MCPFTGKTSQGKVVKTVSMGSTGEELLVRGQITCTTSNVLYIATCEKGDKTCPSRPQYCGETGQTAEERFCGHRNTIVQAYHQGTTIPVGEHFQLPGHSVSDLVFIPVEKIYSRNIFVRKARERYLINKYNLIDSGLNKKL